VRVRSGCKTALYCRAFIGWLYAYKCDCLLLVLLFKGNIPILDVILSLAPFENEVSRAHESEASKT
jgi:hypothetical protein